MMAVKQTIAFIDAADGLYTVLVKKLAEANYPLLFISNDGHKYQQLTDQIKSESPNADISITDCAEEGCWEADIIALFDNTTLEKKLLDRIRVVATQKVVIYISTTNTTSPTLNKAKELQQMLPNSKLVQLFHNPVRLELLVAGASQEAIDLVSVIFENAGFTITEKVKSLRH